MQCVRGVVGKGGLWRRTCDALGLWATCVLGGVLGCVLGVFWGSVLGCSGAAGGGAKAGVEDFVF